MPLVRQILEILEDRIAPASGSGLWSFTGSQSYSYNGNTGDLMVVGPEDMSHGLRDFRYYDADGDEVVIKFNRNIFGDSHDDSIFSFTYREDIGEYPHPSEYRRLDSIDLTGLDPKKIKGLNITFEVIDKGRNGDGKANVGTIFAPGVDLGNITIEGTLGQIVAGDSNGNTSGVKSLKVDTLGLGTGISDNGITSIINGSLDKLVIADDLNEAHLAITGGGSLKSAEIGGSLIGGDAELSGAIEVIAGKITKIIVGEDVNGGTGKYSGAIIAVGDITSAKILGNIRGGTGADGYSGIVHADGKIASVFVGADIVGGSGERSGMIHGHTAITKAEIEGNIEGGDGYAAGRVESAGKISQIKVGGNIAGGTADYAGSIMSTETIKTIEVDGNLHGAGKRGTGSIFSESGIDKVTIGGWLSGGDGHTSGSVSAIGMIKTVSVVKGLVGGNGENSGSVMSFGGTFKRVISEGPVTAGLGSHSGMIYDSTIGGAGSVGGLTKTGTGKLALGGSNVYAGGAVVTQGTLVTTSTTGASIPVGV